MKAAALVAFDAKVSKAATAVHTNMLKMRVDSHFDRELEQETNSSTGAAVRSSVDLVGVPQEKRVSYFFIVSEHLAVCGRLVR